MTKAKITRQTFNTGTIWEEKAGFSRAIRVGDRILVAGTTATEPYGIVGKGDPEKQMYFILDARRMFNERKYCLNLNRSKTE